jgi:hypothetical protein
MDEPKRPWWRQKRWWAAGIIVAVAAYMASLGPLAYGEARGWISRNAAEQLRTPAALYSQYVGWRWQGWNDGGTWPSRPRPQIYYGPAVRGELPLVMPDPDTAATPVAVSDLPPLPAP